MGSLDNQTTEQVLAVDTNCQNFTGKRKIKECELLPLTSSQEANTIHGGEGEEKKFKKKKNKKRERKKERCFTRSVRGVAGVFPGWELPCGQVSRFLSQVTPGEQALGSATLGSDTLDSATLASATLLPRSRSCCASSSSALSLRPGNSQSPWRDLKVH